MIWQRTARALAVVGLAGAAVCASQPIAVLRGTGPDRAKVEELLERCSERED